MTSPSPSPSTVNTNVELTAVEIIEEAITHHLNLTTPPPSPQPTMPLPTFPLTIAIPSPQDSAIHINDRDPSPFTLRQPLPDNTLNSPIDYNREADKENDDPNDPGLPFFPNNPTSTHYYPLYIHTEDPPSTDGPTRVLAKYIFYRKKGQEVVGCMGKGEPWYGDLVFLVTHLPTQVMVPMTMTQVEMFHPDDSRAYAIDEALQWLDQPHVTTKVSCLRDGLICEGQLKKQLADLHC